MDTWTGGIRRALAEADGLLEQAGNILKGKEQAPLAVIYQQQRALEGIVDLLDDLNQRVSELTFRG